MSSIMNGVTITTHEDVSVSILGEFDAPSMLMEGANNSSSNGRGRTNSVEHFAANRYETSATTRNNSNTAIEGSLATELSMLSLANVPTVATFEHSIDSSDCYTSQPILIEAESPSDYIERCEAHHCPRPIAIAAPRSVDRNYSSAATTNTTRREVVTPVTSNSTVGRLATKSTSNSITSEQKTRLLEDLERSIRLAFAGGVGEDQVRALLAGANVSLERQQQRGKSMEESFSPSFAPSIDFSMQSIAEEEMEQQPMESVMENSTCSGPRLDSSDCDPIPYCAKSSSGAAPYDYLMDEAVSNGSGAFLQQTFFDEPVPPQHNGFVYQPLASGHAMMARVQSKEDGMACVMSETAAFSGCSDQTAATLPHDRFVKSYESKASDLAVYPNLLLPGQPSTTIGFAQQQQPMAAAAVPQPLVGFNVVKITNRAPSEIGAHGEVDASLVSAAAGADDSHGNVAIYLFDDNRVGSRAFYREFKSRHELFARAPDRAEKAKIHAKLMARVTSLGGRFLKSAALGGVSEMNYYEISTILEVFLDQTCYVDYNQHLDVRMGRGGHVANHAGNQRYLHMRDQMHAAYVRHGNDNDAKRQMRQRLIDWVHENGGRFVYVSDGRGYISDYKASYLKARQALTESR